MNVSRDKVVSFHYTLIDTEGRELESSRGGEPMTYLHGAGNIIPGLERALESRSVGDSFQVRVEPADAYGERRAADVQRIPSKRLKDAGKLRPGQVIGLRTDSGPVQVTVVKVGRFHVDVDANHPLAGQALTFDVEITAVRDASPEERAHGHVHGPGGAAH